MIAFIHSQVRRGGGWGRCPSCAERMDVRQGGAVARHPVVRTSGRRLRRSGSRAGPLVDVLTTAEDDPRRLAGQVDWATKLELLEAYRERDGLDWTSNRLKAIDLQYHDVRRD
ncbi:hypothetical protein FTX61_21630, partial [Nitriliruptoraceae bacterium ZYF776]|nr:hypothetical protein [Profundirhabdus halotolerans]